MKTKIEIPEKFLNENIFIQINSKEKKINLTYFSTFLKLLVIENYGLIKVYNNQKQP